MKRTKIICTIGPSSLNKNILEKMIQYGMDVARLNFSHGTYKEHAVLIKSIRAAANKMKRSIAIMQDLQGPRIRIGQVAKDGIDLVREDQVMMVFEKKVSPKLIKDAVTQNIRLLPVQFRDLYKYTKKGTSVLINDGLIDIKVSRISKQIIFGTVVKPGIVFSHKGINIPNANIQTKTITNKDKQDLAFGLKQNIDYVALSFVNNPNNVKELRKLISPNKEVEIIAKIETNEGIKMFDDILSTADGIMVARGDLGIEVPADKVPLLQKNMISKCLKAAKPVIVATQMLDSMILNPRPTRAEVSDVANAVIDHTDAVMLSGESAYGKYPVEAVKMMKDIINETEKSPYDDVSSHYLKTKDYNISNSISANVFDLAKENKVKAIVVDSISGLTARLISRYRPETNIAIITNNKKTLHKMSMIWGAYAYYLPMCKNLDELLKKSVDLIVKQKIVKKNDNIIIVTGHPVEKKRGMNLIKVQKI